MLVAYSPPPLSLPSLPFSSQMLCTGVGGSKVSPFRPLSDLSLSLSLPLTHTLPPSLHFPPSHENEREALSLSLSFPPVTLSLLHPFSGISDMPPHYIVVRLPQDS
eukprot:Sspe_Gene.57794::Locus_31711_Transcript_1_1_Confidence_1.000_Length_848::g.57794::m.57794